MAQPLEPLMGSRLWRGQSAAAWSARLGAGRAGRRWPTVLVGAPALLGAQGEAASLLIDPSYD